MKSILLENLSSIPDYIIDSTILAIMAHKEMYDVDVPYRWTVDKDWKKGHVREFPISNMKHWKTPDELQDWPDLYFENLMLPYIYPKIKEWVESNNPRYKDVKFHTRSCWYVIYQNKKNTYVPFHNHVGQAKRTTGLDQKDCCSGVFYLDSPGKSTRTFEYFDENGNKVITYPKTKDVVIFPNDLEHAANQNGSAGSSICIAFNVLFHNFYKEEEFERIRRNM